MATLRSTGPLFRQSGVTTEDLDNLRASGMTNLRRGVETGLMGTDITGMAADEASLRAENNDPAANALRQQIGALQKRQGAYAPDVQDVTKVNSIGSGLDWFNGAVGQGVASMADPMMAATALNAAGTVAGFVPNPVAQLASKGLRLAAPLAAYGINARNLKGEVYNDMVEDPTIMANHSAQDLNDKATMYGGVAGIADTVLPSIVGRQLGGAGLGKGLMKAGGGARALGTLGMEGATEAAQGYGSAALRTSLNPERDTSGDMNERINDFAGGAAGAGPFVAAGHFADQGFRRVGDGVDRVTEKAGQVKDLLGEKVGNAKDAFNDSGAVEAGKGMLGKGVDAVKGMFSKGKETVIDVAGDEDGKITPESVKSAFRDATAGLTPNKGGVSKEDQSILRGDVPENLRDNLDSPDFDDWARQNHEDRSNIVFDHLERMHEAGDATASKLFEEMNNAMDANAQDAVTKRAAEHILKHSELEGQLTAAENFGKIAGFVGKKGGEAAAVAGKGAFNFAKSVWSGMKEGAKKNEQSWTAADVAAQQEAGKKAAGNFIQQQAAMKKSRDRAAALAEQFGGYLAAATAAQTDRYKATRATGAEHMSAFMKNVGYEIADLADSWNLGGEYVKRQPPSNAAKVQTAILRGQTVRDGQQLEGPTSLLPQDGDKRGQQFPNLKLNLNRIVSSMRTAYGDQKAADAIGQLQAMLPDPRVAPLFEAMQAELQTQVGPQGPKNTKEIRDAGAQEVLAQLPQEKEAALMREGIALRTPEGRAMLLEMVEKIATGTTPREAQVALQKMLGNETLNNMLGVVNRHFAKSEAEQETTQTIDDRAMMDDAADGYTLDENGDPTEISTSDFEKGQAERTVSKGIGPKIYGFHAEKNMRTGSSNKNPFAGSTRVSKADMMAWREENSNRMAEGSDLLPDPRGIPTLFKKGQKLSEAMGGGSAVEQKVATMSKALKVDQTPENALRLLKEESNEAGAAALEKLMAKAKAGDEAAQAKIDGGMKAFFENRAGGWAFEPKSAHDVMEDMNMQPGRRLALFREYLVKDGKTNQAKQVGQVLQDLIDVSQGKGPKAASEGKPAKLGRTDAPTRKRVMAAMTEYFKNHELVVGQQLSNRDPSRITEPEVLDMARQGDKVIDLARRPDNLARANQMISDANILTFKSDLSPHKDKTLNIPVGALVFWVKQQRAQMAKMGLEDEQNYSNKSQNTEYLGAVLEGVAILTAGGMVDGMPYKLNASGVRESFNDGIPPSLMLATTNYAGMKFGDSKRSKKSIETKGVTVNSDQYVFALAHPTYKDVLASFGGNEKEATLSMKPMIQAEMATLKEEKGTKGYEAALRKAMRKAGIKRDESGQDNVAVDQRRGAEPFVVDDTPAESESMSGRVMVNGEQYSADRFNPNYREEMDNTTPLDKFPKLKEGAQRDDFADVLGRTKEGGESVYSMRAADLGKERGIDAAQKAPERAAPIVEALNKNYAEGIKMIQQRIKTAQRASYNADKNAAVGGLHYALPVASALSSDNMAMMDLGPVEAKELQALRRQLADMFRSKDAYPKIRTDAAKLMFPDRKIGSMLQAMDAFSKLANEGKAEVAAAQSGKPQPTPAPQPGVLNDQQDPNKGMPATQAQMDEAKAYIQKVLGKEVRVAFEKAMNHSGEWVDVANLIRISTTAAAGQLETAYHESLHAFFSKYVKNDPHMFEVMKSIAEDKAIVERIHALLDGFPAAQAQLVHGEERLAYAYQFWAAGKLDLPNGKPKTFFAKLRQMFKRILGMVNDSERAAALFQAFHDGKLSDPSAAGKVIAAELAKGTWTRDQLRKMDGLVQWVAGKTMPSEVVLTSSLSKRAQTLARELYTNPADDTAGSADEGYMNAKARHAKQYNNLFKNIVRDLSDRDLTDVGEHMMKQTELADIPYQPVRKAVMQTRQLNQRFYRYMTEERGMKLGNLGPKFYPRVWDKSAMIQKSGEFFQMLDKHYPGVLQEGVASSKGKLTKEEVAFRIHGAIINAGEIMQKTGPQRDDGVLAPYFMSKRVRTLDWLAPEHSAPFQDKNFVKTMTTYFHDGARAAEYTSRFGEQGEHLDDAMREIRNELDEVSLNKLTKKEFKDEAARKKWVKDQMRDVRDAVAAMEGTIGKNISNRWRKANSWVTAYQNVRLLPLMLFSSMVDPMAIVGRGAPMKEAYDAYLRGMKEVFQSWGDLFRDEPKKRTADKWELLAEAAGIVDVALFTTHVSDEYSSVFMDGKAKKINDMLFKLNGMEAWDRGMRVAATKSAALFIARHKSLPDATHSARWLAEIGLTPADIHLDARGELITDKNDLADELGISKEAAERQADKMNYALSRWVQSAVLSPNAAHRPAWGSDPHYSMFFHLKQFTYSFHQTVLKRAVNELNYGNLAPLGTFAWYIPVMIASDITKGLIQGGGELPSHMKGMDAAQWIMRGGERAGVLGIGAIGVDAGRDLASLGGPAVEQIIDAFGAPARNTAINALPLHGLYAEALK